MQRNRLKQLLEQLEEVLAELKVEVYSDVDKYRDEDGYYVGEDDDDGSVSYTHLTLPTICSV